MYVMHLCRGLTGVSRLSADMQVAQRARRQHGVLKHAHLVEAGLRRGTIAHRAKTGRLRRLHHGVYALGAGPLPPLAPVIAAVYAYGHRTYASYTSATRIWDFGPQPGGVVHVTVVGRDARSRPGIRVHAVKHLDKRDVLIRHNVPVTAPARTIVDIAADLPPHRLRRAMDEAITKRLTTEAQIKDALERAPTKKGTAALRAILNAAVEPAITRSEAEEIFLGIVEAGGLPRPKVNAMVHGYEVDFYWPDHEVVVEIDGYRYHGHRSAFERDHARIADLATKGIQLIPFTWRQITETRDVALAQTAAALATRSAP
jgi:very-short-patch-repair endonuclease/predicted transcriptional regulator of viral defense system